MAAGAGVAPGIIFFRGVPADPSPDIDSFNCKDCSLILLEIGFCRDLGYHEKLRITSQNCNPLVTILCRHWGQVDLVCIPI